MTTGADAYLWSFLHLFRLLNKATLRPLVVAATSPGAVTRELVDLLYLLSAG